MSMWWFGGAAEAQSQAGGGGDTPHTASAGSYAQTGAAATLLRGLLLVATAGSYAITGADAQTLVGRVSEASAGSYAVSGAAATTTYASPNTVMSADPGSYALSGSAVATLRTHISTANAGSYALSGSSATTAQGHLDSATAGSYALAGQSATTTRGLLQSANPGTYAVTGASATTTRTHLESASSGAYGVTGADATTVHGTPNVVHVASAGSYSLTGAAASTLKGTVAHGDAGSYGLSGAPITTLYGRVGSAEAGVYSLAGSDVTTTYAGTQVDLVLFGDDHSGSSYAGTDASGQGATGADQSAQSIASTDRSAQARKGTDRKGTFGNVPSVLTSITVTPADATIEIDEQLQYEAHGFDQNGRPYDLSVVPIGGELHFGKAGDGQAAITCSVTGLVTGVSASGPDCLVAANAGWPGAIFGFASVTVEGPDPIARWELTEGTGSVASDSTGNGYDLTLTNPVWGSSGGPHLNFEAVTSKALSPIITEMVKDRFSIEVVHRSPGPLWSGPFAYMCGLHDPVDLAARVVSGLATAQIPFMMVMNSPTAGGTLNTVFGENLIGIGTTMPEHALKFAGLSPAGASYGFGTWVHSVWVRTPTGFAYYQNGVLVGNTVLTLSGSLTTLDTRGFPHVFGVHAANDISGGITPTGRHHIGRVSVWWQDIIAEHVAALYAEFLALYS